MRELNVFEIQLLNFPKKLLKPLMSYIMKFVEKTFDVKTFFKYFLMIFVAKKNGKLFSSKKRHFLFTQNLCLKVKLKQDSKMKNR